MNRTPDEWKIDYQAAADELHAADYTSHARRLISFLSDEITKVYRRNTSHQVMVEEVVMEASFLLFDMREVLTPSEMIETHSYLLKESRIAGAYGFSVSAKTKRPNSRGFVMSNMYGGTEAAFGQSYDKGHFICHGAGGGGDWNLFPQLRALNRGWNDEGKLYRKMESYVATNTGTMFFSRPVYFDGSLCPSLLEYGVLMPDRRVSWATFNNDPRGSGPRYGRQVKVLMPPELQGVPNYGIKGGAPTVTIYSGKSDDANRKVLKVISGKTKTRG